MKLQSLVRTVLYSLAIIAPGGALGLAGYHLFNYVKKRRADNDNDIPDQNTEREDCEAKSQDPE